MQTAIRTGDIQTATRRRLQLARIVAILDQLGAEIDPLARQLVADAYQQGADRALSQIAALDVTADALPGAYAGISREAVQGLQEAITGSLRTGRDTIGRQVQDVYAKAGRQAALRAVLGIDASPRAARRKLAAELLRDRDVARLVARDGTGFIDRAGRRWKLDTYAQMVVRTVTREAVVQGSLARMAAHGITIARWSTHGDACPICRPWLGRLVSLDGSTRDFEGEVVADYGATPRIPAHPSCKCSLAAVSVRIERLRREVAGAA